MKTQSIDYTPMKVLIEPIYFDYKGVTYKIPAWYVYDWLSIPQAFQWVVDMNQTENERYWLIHDWFYSQVCDIPISRKEADIELKDSIKWISGYIIYIWVRIWGKYSWKKDRNYVKYKQQIEQTRKELWLNSLTK